MSTHTQSQNSRFGFKWNVNECLRLQREFELLRLSVPKIAALHGRTINAIMYKIALEGFATFNDVYNQTYAIEQEQGQDVLEQGQDLHLEPADLESDEDESDEDANDDDYVPSEDDEDSESDDEDDGSNKHYLYSQVKRMQSQITAILGYLSKGATTLPSNKEVSLDSYGGI